MKDLAQIFTHTHEDLYYAFIIVHDGKDFTIQIFCYLQGQRHNFQTFHGQNTKRIYKGI